MNTRAFKYIKTLSESRTITEAAKKLYMSQSSLTKHLMKIEEEYGVKIFERTNTDLIPTPEGKIVIEYAEKFLSLESELFGKLRNTGDDIRTIVRVGTTDKGGAFLGANIAAFINAYQGIELEYPCFPAKELEEKLLAGEIDLGIYTTPVISEGLEYMPLEQDILVLTVPVDLPVLKGKDLTGNSLEHPLELSVEELRNPSIRYIVSTDNHAMHYAEMDFFEKYKIRMVNPVIIDNVNTRYSVSVGGAGIMLCPTSTVYQPDIGTKIAVCTVAKQKLYRYIVIARKKASIHTDQSEKLWQFMVDKKY